MNEGFYVADTGFGIPESDRMEVFEAGYSTSEDGTGFGLRIVKQIVDAHGWDITVTESNQGGARFDITGVELADC
jgi:signal transduction histidine kinase